MPSRKLLTFIDLIPRSPDSPKLSPILVHLLSTVTNTRGAPHKSFARHGSNATRNKNINASNLQIIFNLKQSQKKTLLYSTQRQRERAMF